LRGQISAVMGKSDPGRPSPYGYDREILGPDGTLLYRVRFCAGRVREVHGSDGRLQATYQKGQSLRKPGKECQAHLVLSTPDRVRVVKDIFTWCIDGVGFKGIAARLNNAGVPSAKGNLWSFTTIKSLLENPVYRGDVVWNRRTESKFYRVHGGRADRMKRREDQARPVLLPEEEWITVKDGVPAIVSRSDWDRAQVMVLRRTRARGGRGWEKGRWLLSGVLKCGHCGQAMWGDRKRQGRAPGRTPTVSHYYNCAGRRRYGKANCPTPGSVRAEPLERWVLDKVAGLVFADKSGVEEAIEQFVQKAIGRPTNGPSIEQLEKEMQDIDATIMAMTRSIDPANLALLNERLTQMRKRKETLEVELRAVRLGNEAQGEDELRRWAEECIRGLAAAVDGRRDEKTREIIACYVDEIRINPVDKTGEMVLNAEAFPLLDVAEKENGCPEGQPCAKLVAGAGFEPAIFRL
jgi:site-specific DNA recombinase